MSDVEKRLQLKENHMRHCLLAPILAACVILAATPARADGDSLTFNLIPADVSGPAGSTVGWGFTITNTSTTSDYLDISGIDSDLFSATDGTPDASIFPFPNLAPGQSLTQLYDPADQLGLFQFTWNAGVAVGTTESGQFRLLGAFCDLTVDQFCAEDGSVVSTVLATASYAATVSPSGVVTTPEPDSLPLMLAGAALLGLMMKTTGNKIAPGHSEIN
jgi:hypothetical protein